MTIHTVELTPGNTIEVPNPRHTPKAKRRTFTAAYKTRILTEYQNATKAQKGELMRREGLYNSIITKWRQQANKAAGQALATPAGRPRQDPLIKENQRLKDQLTKTRDKLATAEKVIEVQGKLSALLEHLATDRATATSE